jgi:DNA polymerase-3 subunit beta
VSGMDFLAQVLGDEPQSKSVQRRISRTVQDPGLRFEVKKSVLQALLEKAQPVVPTKDINPVLKNFQLSAKDGQLRVVATDTELSIISTTDLVAIQRPGVTVFPAKKLLEIARVLEEGDVVIDAQNGEAQIMSGNFYVTLKLQSGEDFPPMPEVADVDFCTVNKAEFLSAIKTVKHAAAHEAVKPSMMMIDVSHGKMTACDGIRFQQVTLGESFPLSFQIPVSAVDNLMKLLSATDLNELKIGDSEYQLVFKVGPDYFIANKVMANFPDMETILLRPAMANTDELNIDRQELVDALRRVRINADPETNAVALVLGEGTLTVQASDRSGNRATETVQTSWFLGARTLTVSHRFLMEMLAAYPGRTCHFLLGPDIKSRKSSILLRDEDTGTVAVLQQMSSSWVG